MEGYKLPAHNVFVDSLPMTSTKKYIRIGLAQILAVEAKASPEIMQPLKCSDAIGAFQRLHYFRACFCFDGKNLGKSYADVLFGRRHGQTIHKDVVCGQLVPLH